MLQILLGMAPELLILLGLLWMAFLLWKWARRSRIVDKLASVEEKADNTGNAQDSQKP